jgi:hypothetical protein
LPGFLEKNVLEQEQLDAAPWLAARSSTGSNDFLVKDSQEGLHFNSRFRNAGVLAKDMRAEGASEADIEQACAVYETVFNHHEFTGRSGAMYKYEGLGSIYWHMVSKLLLATAESVEAARATDAPGEVLQGLVERYVEIRDGIGLHSGPSAYGAFPTDPYSHTPSFTGAQQPGMTGQVKEDFLSRFHELGVRLEDSCLYFDPCLLSTSEFDLEFGIEFTLCGTMVRYRPGNAQDILIRLSDGTEIAQDGSRLDIEYSQSILKREGRISALEVQVAASELMIRP